MAGNLRNSSPTTDIYVYEAYEQTRREMMSKIQQDKIDDVKALKLETFFNLIKTGQVQVNDKGYARFWSAMEQQSLLNNLLLQMSYLPNAFNIIPKIMNKNNKEQINSQALGQMLEEGVNGTLDAFKKLITSSRNDKLAYNFSHVGNERFDITDILMDIAYEDLKGAYQTTAQELNKYKSKGKTNIGATYISTVQGKIDSAGLTADLEITTNSAIEADIAECLRNATFTDKNVVTSRAIMLGQTNPFRVFLSIPAFNRNVQRWRRMLNCFEHHDTNIHKDKNGPAYFYRIRIIYELTGYGGQYSADAQDIFGSVLGDMPFAKYLIINKPNKYLKVIPVNKLLNIDTVFKQSEDKASTDWRYAVYGPVKLNQHQIKLDSI